MAAVAEKWPPSAAAPTTYSRVVSLNAPVVGLISEADTRARHKDTEVNREENVDENIVKSWRGEGAENEWELMAYFPWPTQR